MRSLVFWAVVVIATASSFVLGRVSGYDDGYARGWECRPDYCTFEHEGVVTHITGVKENGTFNVFFESGARMSLHESSRVFSVGSYVEVKILGNDIVAVEVRPEKVKS